MLSRELEEDGDGNHGDPDSPEEPELSCSDEEFVTPLLGTQSINHDDATLRKNRGDARCQANHRLFGYRFLGIRFLEY